MDDQERCQCPQYGAIYYCGENPEWTHQRGAWDTPQL